MSKRFILEERQIPYVTEPEAELGKAPTASAVGHVSLTNRNSMFWSDALKLDNRSRIVSGNLVRSANLGAVYDTNWNALPPVQAALSAAKYSERAQQRDTARLRAALGYKRVTPRKRPNTDRRHVLESPRAATSRVLSHPHLTPRGELPTSKTSRQSKACSGNMVYNASNTSTYHSDYSKPQRLDSSHVPTPPASAKPPKTAKTNLHGKRLKQVTKLLEEVDRSFAGFR